MKHEYEDTGGSGDNMDTSKDKMMVAAVGVGEQEEEEMDEMLATLEYKVRSSDMADVAQKLEQLEMAMGMGGVGGAGATVDDASSPTSPRTPCTTIPPTCRPRSRACCLSSMRPHHHSRPRRR